MPGWYLEILESALPALQAEDQIAAMTAARAAQLARSDYMDLLRRYQRLAAPYVEPEPIKMAEGDDKERAIEFFRQAGIKLQD